MLRVIGLWQARGEVTGLPIGPDASRVLGNALLKPVDDAIAATHRTHLRWMDDILVFGETIAACKDVVGQRPRGNEHLHGAFDRYIIGADPPEPQHFRWFMRTFENRRDPYAVAALAESPELMNLDPRVSAKYLVTAGLGKERVHEAVMRKLDHEPQDAFDGLDLHLLRAESIGPGRGRSEGRAFLSIAEDRQRRSPIRAWGYMAIRRPRLGTKTKRWRLRMQRSIPSSVEQWC